MTSSPHGPYVQGYTRATMAGPGGRQPAGWREAQRTGREPDRSLRLDCGRSETLVCASQLAAVNTFPGHVHTARHTRGAGSARSS